MANRTMSVQTAEGGSVPLRLVDNGDGTWSFGAALVAEVGESVAVSYRVYSFAVAAGETDEPLGGTGAVGDDLAVLWIQPATTAPGAVVVKDGDTTKYTWPGSADYPAGLPPFPVTFGRSEEGAWKVTTGANVSVLANGTFTA